MNLRSITLRLLSSVLFALVSQGFATAQEESDPYSGVA